jgi:hypothetical protein
VEAPASLAQQRATDTQVQAFCRLVADHELIDKDWLASIALRPNLTKFQHSLSKSKNMELVNYIKDTITAAILAFFFRSRQWARLRA